MNEYCLSVAERDGGYVQPPVNVSDCEGTQVVLSHSLPVVVVFFLILRMPSALYSLVAFMNSDRADDGKH